LSATGRHLPPDAAVFRVLSVSPVLALPRFVHPADPHVFQAAGAFRVDPILDLH
jgi:hypothetical protein